MSVLSPLAIRTAHAFARPPAGVATRKKRSWLAAARAQYLRACMARPVREGGGNRANRLSLRERCAGPRALIKVFGIHDLRYTLGAFGRLVIILEVDAARRVDVLRVRERASHVSSWLTSYPIRGTLFGRRTCRRQSLGDGRKTASLDANGDTATFRATGEHPWPGECRLRRWILTLACLPRLPPTIPQ